MQQKRKSALVHVPLWGLAALMLMLSMKGDDPRPAPDAPEHEMLNSDSRELQGIGAEPALAVEPVPVCKPGFIAVRDLASGYSMPGLAFSLAGPEVCQYQGESVTDTNGNLTICTTHFPKIGVSSPWKLPGRQFQVPGGVTSELWIYRDLKVIVRVEIPGGEEERAKALQRVHLDTAAGLAASRGALSPEAPWNPDWLGSRGLDCSRIGARPDENGMVEATMPAVKGQTVRANLPGYKPVRTEVVIPDDPELPAKVELRFERKSVRVAGRLVDEHGSPVTGMQVALYVKQEVSLRDLKPEILRLGEHAYTAAGRKDGSAYVVYSSWCKTGTSSGRNLPPGEFEFSMNVTGDALLVVHPPEGFLPVRVSLGHMTSDISGLDVTLESDRNPQRMRLLAGGGPLIGKIQVSVADLSMSDFTPASLLSLGADGTICANLFEEGREYWLTISAGTACVASGKFLYRGQDTIDVKKDLGKIR